MDSESPTLAMEALLLDLFSAEELRRWLRTLPDGQGLVHSLPTAPAPLAELAHLTVIELHHRGKIGADLFERLVEWRPGQAQRIRQVAQLWVESPLASWESDAEEGLTRPLERRSVSWRRPRTRLIFVGAGLAGVLSIGLLVTTLRGAIPALWLPAVVTCTAIVAWAAGAFQMSVTDPRNQGRLTDPYFWRRAVLFTGSILVVPLIFRERSLALALPSTDWVSGLLEVSKVGLIAHLVALIGLSYLEVSWYAHHRSSARRRQIFETVGLPIVFGTLTVFWVHYGVFMVLSANLQAR